MDYTLKTHFARIPTVPESPLNVSLSEFRWYDQIIAFKCLFYVMSSERPDMTWRNFIGTLRNPWNWTMLKWLLVPLVYTALSVLDAPVVFCLITLQKFHLDLPPVLQYLAVFYGSYNNLELEIALDYYILYVMIDRITNRLTARDPKVAASLATLLFLVFCGAKFTFICSLVILWEWAQNQENWPVLAAYAEVSIYIWIRYRLCPPGIVSIFQCPWVWEDVLGLTKCSQASELDNQ